MEDYLGHWTSLAFFGPRSENDMSKFHNSFLGNNEVLNSK